MLAAYLKYLYFLLLIAGPVIIFFKRNEIPVLIWLFVPIYVLALAVEVAGHILLPKGVNTILYYHLYQIFEALFLFIYYYLLFKEQFQKKIVSVMLVLYVAAVVYWYIIPPSLLHVPVRYEFVVEAIFISVLSCIYLYQLYRSDDEIDFTKNPHFWINIANLIFYSGDMIFMWSRDFLNQNFRDVFGKLSYISYILNLFLYITYIKAFLCSTKEK
jgi:hypothetical protein